MRSSAAQSSSRDAAARPLGLMLGFLLILLLAVGIWSARAAVDLLYFEAVQISEGVQIRWATASELDTAGFYVTRSGQINGIFQRLHASLIPSQGDGVTEREYVFTDEDVELGQTYYYKLESVDTSGVSGFTDAIVVTFGVTYTATPTLTGTRGTATPTATGPTATPTLIGTLATQTPTRTGTLTIPTPTFQPTRTGTIITTVTVSVSPSITPTPTATTTFVPLPRLTLLFPVLSPTPTATRTATLTPIPVLLAEEAALEEQAGGPDLEVLGGLILLLWLALGSFLVVYLRRVGY